MQCAVIQDEQLEGIGKRLCKVLSPELESTGIEPREFEQEAFARARFDSPVEIKMIELVYHRRAGLSPARRDAPPDDRQQADATCILGKHCDRGAWRLGLDLLLEERGEISGKLGHS